MDAYIYQYLLGGLVFAVGLVYAWRQGYVSFAGHGLRNLAILCGGLAILMAIQGYLQYGTMETLPKGPPGPPLPDKEMLGTPLDYGVIGLYFLGILAIGTWFGRQQKTAKDFFFGGQRFSWWLIAFSLVATTIGSYSFVKYSKVAYQYGVGSSQTYLNDWFWLPLLLFGWLPIVYFSRITSIPEYFERRFGPKVRAWATALILLYLVGYVGVNLFTMGKAMNQLLGWPIFWSALGVACVSITYVTAGGQTSVIMTDLFQGVMLLATGLVILYLGADYLGGIDQLWNHLPREHRTAFPNFNEDPGYNSVGIFWQDAMANTAVFYFLNQGIMMRFLAAKSVHEARKAALVVPVILMPIAACVVASGGWVGKALEHAGVLPPDMEPARVFFIASEFLSQPGVFGLVMAALTAALMSTVDTLITAVAAIVVNDVYKPYFQPKANERDLLKVARITSVGVAIVGIALVPVFMNFDSIYAAHGAFTAAVTPPMLVALLLSVFWKRFTRKAALATMAGGTGIMIFSIFVPEVITPFAHGIPMKEVGDGLFSGAKQYKFIRAFFGLVCCTGIGVGVTLFTQPETAQKMKGLVWGTLEAALARYKGSPGVEHRFAVTSGVATPWEGEEVFVGEGHLPQMGLSRGMAEALGAKEGDLLYVTDPRAWLGGLKSCHGIVGWIEEGTESQVFIGEGSLSVIAGSHPEEQTPVKVEKLY